MKEPAVMQTGTMNSVGKVAVMQRAQFDLGTIQILPLTINRFQTAACAEYMLIYTRKPIIY